MDRSCQQILAICVGCAIGTWAGSSSIAFDAVESAVHLARSAWRSAQAMVATTSAGVETAVFWPDPVRSPYWAPKPVYVLPQPGSPGCGTFKAASKTYHFGACDLSH